MTIDVLANDADPDGGPLEIIDVQVLNSPNSVADVDPADPNHVVFTPGFDAGNYEYFTYDVEDDDGGTDHGAGLRVRRRRDPVVGDRRQSVAGRLRRGAARQDGGRRC